MKVNIYKIQENLYSDLRNKLLSDSVGTKEISTLDLDGWKLELFFSTEEASKTPIWWLDDLKSNFPQLTNMFNRSYFAIILAKRNKEVFCISYGKSHFYIKHFCESNFGMDLAEKIADGDDVRLKNSRFFKSKKNKSIVSFRVDSAFDVEAGESTDFLKTAVIDKSKWGNVVTFGESVTFNLNIEFKKISSLLNNIEYELNNSNDKLHIPRVRKERNETKILELDNKLFAQFSENGSASFDEISLSGIFFIFNDDYNFYLFNEGERVGEENLLKDLSFQTIQEALQLRNINTLQKFQKVYVKIKNEHYKGFSKPLKYFLEFFDGNHCLIDGYWYFFDQNYIEFLRKEVDRIELQINTTLITKMSEDDVIKKITQENGYTVCHKQTVPIDKLKLEVSDLRKDKELVFVKCGTPQKLSYVVDQANASLLALKGDLIKDLSLDDIERLTLWLVLDRKGKIEKISEIESLIFMMKLVDWKKQVLAAGKLPAIKLSYFQ